jgi:hypothetical protein
MADVIETASTGRAKCRACGKPTAKGELRFGERVPNPFAEGEAELTYWFHVPCAAYRRCERFVTLTPEQLAGVPEAVALRARAEFGVAHHRLPRITGLERAKSGRAKCRHCKEVIAAQAPRIALGFWEDGRFGPMGFVHLTCAPAYFETREFRPWLEQVAPDAVRELDSEIEAARRA